MLIVINIVKLGYSKLVMCLAIPGQIISIEENKPDLKMAKVSFGGIQKLVCLDFVPDAKIGDYVIVHVGFALNKIDEEEAEETLNTIREIIELAE